MRDDEHLDRIEESWERVPDEIDDESPFAWVDDESSERPSAWPRSMEDCEHDGVDAEEEGEEEDFLGEFEGFPDPEAFEDEGDAPEIEAQKSGRRALTIPYRFICSVEVKYDDNSKGFGTGVLISPRHVLTCAHLLLPALEPASPESEGPVRRYPKYAWASPARDRRQNQFGRVQASWTINPKWDPSKTEGEQTHRSTTNDYAILTLEESVGDRKFRSLGGKPLCFWGSRRCGGGTRLVRAAPKVVNGRQAFFAGYPLVSSRAKEPRHSQVVVRGRLDGADWRRRLMWISSRGKDGYSGSPVWIRSQRGLDLVGLYAGADGKRGGRIIRVTDEFLRTINGWMGGAHAGRRGRNEAEAEAETDRSIDDEHWDDEPSTAAEAAREAPYEDENDFDDEVLDWDDEAETALETEAPWFDEFEDELGADRDFEDEASTDALSLVYVKEGANLGRLPEQFSGGNFVRVSRRDYRRLGSILDRRDANALLVTGHHWVNDRGQLGEIGAGDAGEPDNLHFSRLARSGPFPDIELVMMTGCYTLQTNRNVRFFHRIFPNAVIVGYEGSSTLYHGWTVLSEFRDLFFAESSGLGIAGRAAAAARKMGQQIRDRFASPPTATYRKTNMPRLKKALRRRPAIFLPDGNGKGGTLLRFRWNPRTSSLETSNRRVAF